MSSRITFLIIICLCRPPLRGFLLDGDFFVAASLATTLTKIALRYVSLVQEKKKQNVRHLLCFHYSCKEELGVASSNRLMCKFFK